MAQVSVSQSVQRTIQVLDLFGLEQRPLTRSEIGEQLQAPRSSVAALLRAMAELGVLRLDRRTWTYFPTARIGRIARWIDKVYTLDRAVLDAIKRLHAKTRETVTLLTPLHDIMEVIYVEPGQYPVSYVAEIGQVVPLWTSAVGRAYLSTLEDDTVHDMFRASPHGRRRQIARQSISEIMVAIRKVRRDGYAMVTGSVASDASAIAFSVRQDPQEQRKALVIATCGPKSRLVLHRHQIVTLMRSELGGIEDQLMRSISGQAHQRGGA